MTIPSIGGLARLLVEHDDIEVVGQACDADETLQLANKLIPDIAVINVALPHVSGIELTKQMKGVYCTPVSQAVTKRVSW